MMLKTLLATKFQQLKKTYRLLLLTLCVFVSFNAHSGTAPAKSFYQITSPGSSNVPLPTTRFSSPSAACSSMSNVSLPLTLGGDISREYTYYIRTEYNPASGEGRCYHNYKHIYLTWPLCCTWSQQNESNSEQPSFAITKYYVCPNNPNDAPSRDSTKRCEVPTNLNPKGVADPKIGCETTSNPISYSAGNKVLHELDYSTLASMPMAFERTYNSTETLRTENQGEKWLNGFNKFIPNFDGGPFVYRQGGKAYLYTRLIQGGVFKYLTDADISDTLERVSVNNNTYWRLTDAESGNVEHYTVVGSGGYFSSHNGNVSSISNRAGHTQTMRYSCKYADPTCPTVTPDSIALGNFLLISVTDSFGRSLNFTYDNMNRIKTMTNPAGGVYQYAYDANNNLVSVTYPDLKVKTYHYGEVGHVSTTPAAAVVNANLLTGITDENGHRYANYYYDAQGRAFQENLAGGADATDLVYNTDGVGNPISTVVTDARGNARTHNFTTVLGVVKSTGQSQPAGSGCAAAASELTYDANGNVKTRVDFNANKSTYDYDMSRNLETSRTEGLTTADAATPATRTITTSWHATWRLPHIISEYSGKVATGTPLKRTTYLYDDKGNITSYTVEDPVRSLSRTTTTSYVYSTAVLGLILEKTVDGPLPTDIDRIRYYYYPHDATCAASNADPIVDPITGTSPPNYGCRGQLSQVIQSSMFMILYNRYNHHGQLEEWTDSNQIYYTQSYDLRQRLIRSTVENEQTFFTYDDAGQLKKTTFPDGSELNYSYDQAHRLTEISNAMGDKVVYTLDDNGNRTNEEMFDSSGTLTKSITRQFDALNRAQTVTGE